MARAPLYRRFQARSIRVQSGGVVAASGASGFARVLSQVGDVAAGLQAEAEQKAARAREPGIRSSVADAVRQAYESHVDDEEGLNRALDAAREKLARGTRADDLPVLESLFERERTAALDRAANRRLQQQDAAEAERGLAEGALAGLQPGFAPVEGQTPYDRAYNRAGLDTFMAQKDTEVRLGIEEIIARHPSDPVALQKDLAAYRQKFLSGLPAGALTGGETLFQRLSTGAIADARTGRRQQVLDNRKAAVLDDLAARERTLARLAARSHTPGGQAALDAELQGLKGFLLNQGPKGSFSFDGVDYAADASRSGIYSAAQIQDTLIKAQEQVTEEGLYARFLAQPAAGRAGFAEALEQRYLAGEDLGIGQDAFRQLRTRMLVEIGRDESRAQAAATALVKRISSVRGLAEKGYPVNATEIAGLRRQVEANGDPRAIQAMADMEQVSRFAGAIRGLTPGALQDVINEERSRLAGDTPTLLQADMLAMAEGFLAEMKRGLDQDPLSFAARTGSVEIGALDLGRPETLQARRDAALAVAEHYGRPLRLLTDEEAEGLAEQWGQASRDERFRMLAGLQGGFGDDAGAVLEQMAPKQPELAHVGGLLASAPERMTATVKDALDGFELIRNGQAMTPKSVATHDVTRAVLGHAAPLHAAALRGRLIETARAIYSARAQRAGASETDLDEDLWEASLQAAAGRTEGTDGAYGGIAEFNGEKLIAPPTVRAKNLKGLIGGVDERQFAAASNGAAVYANGKPVSRDDILEYGYLVNADQNSFYVSWKVKPSAGEPALLTLKDGTPFEIDVAALDDAARRRAAAIQAARKPRVLP